VDRGVDLSHLGRDERPRPALPQSRGHGEDGGDTGPTLGRAADPGARRRGNNQEFEAFGLPVRSPKEKIEALEEAITIIRGVWFAPSFTFEGRHYRTVGAEVEPKPSRPIPIWLGTYGPKALELTGRMADGWLPSMSYAPPDVVREKLKVVKEAAERAGRDPGTMTYAYNVSLRVGGDPAPDPERMVVGEPGAVAERLASLMADGITCLNLWLSGDRTEQRERLANDVLPAVRELAR